MPLEKFQLVTGPVAPISAHAWNATRTEVAISPNSHEVKIYSYKGGQYTLLHTLGEHTQSVTAIDWSATTDRIVTASQDRNAYVWNRTKVDGKETWTPVLVILRINRAATCVKWSPLGNKFAVGSGSRLISVCYYEEQNDWWVSKHIKKPIRSTVTCLDWHPGNILIAAGGTDFKVRVFSGYIKEVEEKPAATNWGKKLPFGEVLGEYSTSGYGGGWVHSVSFSASGDQLAYVAHDASISVVDATQEFKVARFATPDLPYLCVNWLTPKSLIVAGYDYVPVAYSWDGSALKNLGRLDVAEKKETKALSAMDKFKTLDRKGTTDSATTNTNVDSNHQNAIKELSIFAGDKTKVTKFCTIGVDGQIILWDLADALKTSDIKLL